MFLLGVLMSGAWSLHAEGQLRERFESSNNPVFGLEAPPQSDYLLHRVMVLGELRHEDSFRAVAELVGGFTSGWSGPPAATQDNPLDALQAFAELSRPQGDGRLAMRLGRQELKLGSSRLVSVREAPNVHRSFDGVRATWSRPGAVVDVFALRPVFPEDGIFDDKSASAQAFWGVYATFSNVVPSWSFDTYYLGLDRDDAEFAQGVEHEIRHTVGVRAFGGSEPFDWNLEAAWQWGTFGAAKIRAWTVSADVGYTLAELPLQPRFGLKADIISGDDNLHDGTLRTFNPLFPRLPYFSEANLATPANLIDMQPGVSLSPTPTLQVNVSWNILWKYARADAFYTAPLSAVDDTLTTQSRSIGEQMIAELEWSPTHALTIAATYVDFSPQTVVREAGGRGGSFFALSAQILF